MNRREALLAISTIFGGTIIGAQQMLAGVVNAAGWTLSASQLAFLNEVADTIIPTTPDSPGAKAANIAAFMQEIAGDFYSEKEYTTLVEGPAKIDEASRAKFAGRGFLDLTPGERFDLLMTFETAKPQPDYYRTIKQLTVWGYFSSEIGATQALVNIPVPGRYDGDVTITPGTKAWAQ